MLVGFLIAVRVAVRVTGNPTSVLYHAAFHRTCMKLTELALRRARLIEAIARFHLAIPAARQSSGHREEEPSCMSVHGLRADVAADDVPGESRLTRTCWLRVRGGARTERNSGSR